MLYVSTSCIQKNNIAEIISELAEQNILNIELSGGTDYYETIEYDLKKLKEIYNLQYVCHAYFPPPKIPFVVNLASCNDEIYYKSVNHYVQCIDMLRRIECKVLSIHAGFMVEIGAEEIGKKLNDTVVYDEGKAYDRFCTAYEKLKRICGKNGIELYLENNVLSKENYKAFGYHNYLMMTDYESIMAMKSQMDFNLLLDLGHLNVSDNTLGLEYEKECNELKEIARWFHLSDNDGISDEHKPLKSGSIIMKMFRQIYNSKVNITLETIGNIEEILESIKIINLKH